MSIPISDKFKPKGVGGFALVDSEDVEHEGGRLNEFLPKKVTKQEYDDLVTSGKMNPKTPYFIVG